MSPAELREMADSGFIDAYYGPNRDLGYEASDLCQDPPVLTPEAKAAASTMQPIDVFFFFLPKKLWRSIAEQSNKYEKGLGFRVVEILRTLGLLIARSLNRYKSVIEKRWSKSAHGAVPAGTWSKFIGRQRLCDIFSYLHFSDNSDPRAKVDGGWAFHSPEASLARRKEWATLHSSKWTPKSKNLKRLRQDSSGVNGILPEGYFFIDRILDVDTTDPNNSRYRVLWADALKEEKTGWVAKSAFTDINAFESDIRLILRMKASPLFRAEFLRTDPVAQVWKTRRRSQGDDGEDGWCAFMNVGVALEQLGAYNPVTAERIKAFTFAGALRRGVAGFPGAWWRALKPFILGLRQYGVKVDAAELNNPRHKNGEHGIKAIEKMNLEPGIYLLGAYKKVLYDLGHTVDLEVTEDKVTVYDEDEIGDVEDIIWVHAISFVYRIKLAKQ